MQQTTEAVTRLSQLVQQTPAGERPALVVALAALLADLGGRMAADRPSPCPEPGAVASGGAGRLLTSDEAAAQAQVSKRWLLRHTRGLRFRRDLSRKNVRFEEAGFLKWLATLSRPLR